MMQYAWGALMPTPGTIVLFNTGMQVILSISGTPLSMGMGGASAIVTSKTQI